jgi:hypothetical protein
LDVDVGDAVDYDKKLSRSFIAAHFKKDESRPKNNLGSSATLWRSFFDQSIRISNNIE